MIYQSEALTLRTYPYSEAHKIVVFLTREFGKVRGMAHGAKKAKGRFGSSLEPMTHSLLTFSQKESSDLAVIQNCEIIRAFPAYSLSWEANLHFSYFAELLLECSQEKEESERLFRLATSVLVASESGPLIALARYFELWLLQLEGVLPRLGRILSPNTVEKARAFMLRPPQEISEGDLSEGQLRELERISGDLIEKHLEKRLKTRKILKSLVGLN